MNENVSVIN